MAMSHGDRYSVADPEGVRGVARTPLESKLFHFHGEFKEKLGKLIKLTPT